MQSLSHLDSVYSMTTIHNMNFIYQVFGTKICIYKLTICLSDHALENNLRSVFRHLLVRLSHFHSSQSS